MNSNGKPSLFADHEAIRLVEDLCNLLNVERLDTNLFRGAVSTEPWPRVFGGQVVGQAAAAAIHSVEQDRPIHSLHAYFIRPGDPELPIIYRVEPDRDGRSFSVRRVVAYQNGEPILNLAASFHHEEEGLSHSETMPEVTGPEQLINVWDRPAHYIEKLPVAFRGLAQSRRAIEFRRVEPWSTTPDPRRTRQHLWFRCTAPLPDSPELHRAMLAYASDTFLVEATLLTHGIDVPESAVQGASIDHALWFHGPVRMDEWMLYLQESLWSGGGRGLSQGRIFTRDGRLVASAAQEGLIRMRRQNI